MAALDDEEFQKEYLASYNLDGGRSMSNNIGNDNDHNNDNTYNNDNKANANNDDSNNGTNHSNSNHASYNLDGGPPPKR